VGIPYAGGSIETAGHDFLAVTTEGHRPDRVPVLHGQPDLFTGARVPDVGVAVHAGRKNSRPVWADDGGRHREIFETNRLALGLTALRIIELNLVVLRDHELFALKTISQASNSLLG